MLVYQTGRSEPNGRQRAAEDDYAVALQRYWGAVKEAERTIAPYFTDGMSLTPEQLDVIAGVVAQVSAAENEYFEALEAAGRAVHPRIARAEDN